MNNWEELEIDNLPPDILTGNYDFEILRLSANEWVPLKYDNAIFDILRMGLDDSKSNKFRYRHRQPEPPTVEEEAEEYISRFQFYRGPINEMIETIVKDQAKKAFIAGRQSATIPREAP